MLLGSGLVLPSAVGKKLFAAVSRGAGIPTTAPEASSTVPEPAVTMLLGSGLVLASAVGKRLLGR
ncbi:MAG: hypothetical protein JWP63_6401 [Candidatus Solibacter sp.]|nr:hypothetical protein [Candidatus Solibacter sp.]